MNINISTIKQTVMSEKHRLFCSKPFTWFEVQSRGDVYMCCPAWLNTSIGNLEERSVTEIWNGEKAQKIRESILDGSFKYCDALKCPFLQTVSGPVQRVEDVTDEDLHKIIVEQSTVLQYGPQEVNCSYDRSCNLACPSCRSEVIVELDKEQEILSIEHKLRKEALKEARFLYITGSGDPFGSPYFKKWLQTMKIEEMPRLEKIHLHTNAQLWTPLIWNSISDDIKNLISSAEISVDAASPETYSINRRGGSFDKLLRNFEFISTLRKNGPLKTVVISMVVQANNFREMPDFVKIGQSFGFDVVYFSQLVNWGTFSQQEFSNRAVFLPNHPQYLEFVNILQSELFDEQCVYLGNLTEIRRKPNFKPKISFLDKVKNLTKQVIAS